MRLSGAVKSDMKFQFKHGFYSIYIFISIFYLIAMSFIQEDYLKYVLPILIYSDPAALGLFFIGGILMLERMEGIIYYLMITPLTIREYIFSKVISLSLLSVIVGVSLSLLSKYTGKVNYFYLIIGILLSSMLFVFIGIIIAADCQSLNQYFIKMVPLIIILLVPCVSIIGFKYSYFLTVIPSVAALRIVIFAYVKGCVLEVIPLIGYVTIINYLLLGKVEKVFEEKIMFGG